MPDAECWAGINRELGGLRGRFDEEARAREIRDREKIAIEAEIFERLRALEASKSEANGALWALSKIGMGVVALFSAVGWVAVHGVPVVIRKALGLE